MADLVTTQKAFLEQFPWDQTDKILTNLRRLMSVLDVTLLPLLASKVDFDNATAETRALILQRFNDQIQPIFDEILQQAALGAIFTASSDTEVRVGLGLKSFILDRGSWLLFTPSPYMAAISKSDGRRAMLGTLASFDRGNGQLVMQIQSISGGDLLADDWYICASPPPYVPVGFNAGSYDNAPPASAVPYVSMPTASSGGSDGGLY